jgi:hypothetical protein
MRGAVVVAAALALVMVGVVMYEVVGASRALHSHPRVVHRGQGR